MEFEVSPTRECPITVASNINSFNGVSPYVDFLVKPGSGERITINVNFTRIINAVSVKVVYGIPPEYRNLPNGLERTSDNTENTSGNAGNETVRIPKPENATLLVEAHPEDAEV